MDSFYVIEAIVEITKQIGYSYPYSSGSATINCRFYSKDELTKILNYFLKRECSIVVSHSKNQIKITGYMTDI